MGMKLNVKRLLPVLLAALMMFSAFSIAGCANNLGSTQSVQSSSGSGTSGSSYSYVPEPGETQATDFTLTGLDGKSYTLSDFEGKPVLLNFWATWCPPCKGEMPLLEQVYQEWKDKGLIVLGVSIGESPSTVQKFIDQYGYDFNILVDFKQDVAGKYQVRAIPTTYFIDKNGIIQDMQVGAFPDKAHIEAYLNKLVQ